MGYEVHITRKKEWFSEDGPALSLEDWLDYVSRDHELRADGFAEATTPSGDTIRVDSPGIAVWTAYSGHSVDGNMAWFCHFGDRITVKNPDPEILQKMHQIASSLGARVQGDEGEEYASNGEPVESTAHAQQTGTSTKREWWQFWR